MYPAASLVGAVAPNGIVDDRGRGARVHIDRAAVGRGAVAAHDVVDDHRVRAVAVHSAAVAVIPCEDVAVDRRNTAAAIYAGTPAAPWAVKVC